MPPLPTRGISQSVERKGGRRLLRERGLREPTPVRVLGGGGFHVDAVVPLYKPGGIPLMSSGLIKKLTDATSKAPQQQGLSTAPPSSSSEGVLTPKDMENTQDAEDALLYRVLDNSPDTGTIPSIAFPSYRHTTFTGRIPSGSTRLQQAALEKQSAAASFQEDSGGGEVVEFNKRLHHEVLSTTVPEWYRSSNGFNSTGVSLAVVSRALESFYKCAFRNGAMRSTYHVLCKMPRGVKPPLSTPTTSDAKKAFSNHSSGPTSRIGKMNPAFASSTVIERSNNINDENNLMVQGSGSGGAVVTRSMGELVSDGSGKFVARGHNLTSTPLLVSPDDYDPNENPLAFISRKQRQQQHQKLIGGGDASSNSSSTTSGGVYFGSTWSPHINGDQLFRGEYLNESGTINAVFNNLPIVQTDELHTFMKTHQKLISLFTPPTEGSGRRNDVEDGAAALLEGMPEFWLDAPGSRHPFIPNEALLGLQPWSVTRQDILRGLAMMSKSDDTAPKSMPRWLWAWMQGAARRASVHYQLMTYNPFTRVALYELKSTSLDEHQLRALMARCGAPVVGDVAYNEELAASVALSHKAVEAGMISLAAGSQDSLGQLKGSAQASARPIFQAMRAEAAKKSVDQAATAAPWSFQPHPLLSGIVSPSELKAADEASAKTGRASLFETPLRTVVLPFAKLRHSCLAIYNTIEEEIAPTAFTEQEQAKISKMPESSKILLNICDMVDVISRMWNAPNLEAFHHGGNSSRGGLSLSLTRIQRLEAAVYQHMVNERRKATSTTTAGEDGTSSALPLQGLTYHVGIAVKCFHILATMAHTEHSVNPNTKFPTTRAVATLSIGSGLALTKLTFPSPHHPVNASLLQNMELSRQLSLSATSFGGASSSDSSVGGGSSASGTNGGVPKDTADSFVNITVSGSNDGGTTASTSEDATTDFFVPSSLQVASKMKSVLPPLTARPRDGGGIPQVVASILPPSVLFSNDIGVLAAVEDIKARLTPSQPSTTSQQRLMGTIASPEAVTVATEILKTVTSMVVVGGLGREEVGYFYCAGCKRYGDHPTRLCNKGSSSSSSTSITDGAKKLSSLEEDEATLLNELQSLRNSSNSRSGHVSRQNQLSGSSLAGTPVETEYFGSSQSTTTPSTILPVDSRLSMDAIFNDSVLVDGGSSLEEGVDGEEGGVRTAKDHHEAAMRALQESGNYGASARHVELEERREKAQRHIQARNQQLPGLHHHRVNATADSSTSPSIRDGGVDGRRRMRCSYCYGSHHVEECPKLGSGGVEGSSGDGAAWAKTAGALAAIGEGGMVQRALARASEEGYVMVGSSGLPRVLLAPRTIPNAVSHQSAAGDKRHSVTATLRATLSSKGRHQQKQSVSSSSSLPESFDMTVFTDAVAADPRVIYCIRCGEPGHFHEVCPTLPQGFAVLSPLHAMMKESAQKVMGRTKMGSGGDGLRSTLDDGKFLGGDHYGPKTTVLNSRDHCTVCLGKKSLVAHEPHQCPKRVLPQVFLRRHPNSFSGGDSQYFMYHPCGVHLKYAEQEEAAVQPSKRRPSFSGDNGEYDDDNGRTRVGKRDMNHFRRFGTFEKNSTGNNNANPRQKGSSSSSNGKKTLFQEISTE